MQLRAFILLASGQKFEAHHSPAAFLESAIEPDGVEALRRKDAIILRRNAELVSLWEEVKTQWPWQKAEALAEAGEKLDLDSKDRLLATIIVMSDAKHVQNRDASRKTWCPATFADVERVRKQYGLVVKFAVLKPSGPLQESIHKEAVQYGDIYIIDEEGIADSDPRRALASLAAAVKDPKGDSDFYIISRDKVPVNFASLHEVLDPKRTQGNLYLGCLHTAMVVRDDSSRWYEPDSYRFGKTENGEMFYPPHAGKDFYAISRHVARHLARSRTVLHYYKIKDTSMGAWMMALAAAPTHESSFCCDATRKCGQTGKIEPRCAAYLEPQCDGVCGNALSKMTAVYNSCIKKN